MWYKLLIEDKIEHSLCLIIFLYSLLDLQEDFEMIAYKKSIEQQCKKFWQNRERREKAEKDRLKELEKRKSDVR